MLQGIIIGVKKYAESDLLIRIIDNEDFCKDYKFPRGRKSIKRGGVLIDIGAQIYFKKPKKGYIINECSLAKQRGQIRKSLETIASLQSLCGFIYKSVLTPTQIPKLFLYLEHALNYLNINETPKANLFFPNFLKLMGLIPTTSECNLCGNKLFDKNFTQSYFFTPLKGFECANCVQYDNQLQKFPRNIEMNFLNIPQKHISTQELCDFYQNLL